tara:strand:+ start:2644 stop:3318 length:675 start_codon:yes stop_codon:yes gene_type:complete
MTANKKTLLQRMHEAMANVTYVQKEKKSGMQYSITSHDDVTAKVRPALHNAGVIYYPTALVSEQVGNRTQVSMTVRFASIDDKEDFIDVPSLGYGIDNQDKGPGKAISYAVKYALLKALGLETGDDPDLDQKTEHKADINEGMSSSRTHESNTVKPKPKTIEAPSWHEWAKKTHEEIASVRNEQERNELRTRITPAYQTCQKEAPELAKSIRESLTERKAHFAK